MPTWAPRSPGDGRPRCQMQSGVTGINAIRIYNPVRQARDQDPDGIFLREWIPELRGVPPPEIHEPHTLPVLLQSMYGIQIGRDYPMPIVDNAQAMRDARARMWAVRRAPYRPVRPSNICPKLGVRSPLRGVGTGHVAFRAPPPLRNASRCQPLRSEMPADDTRYLSAGEGADAACSRSDSLTVSDATVDRTIGSSASLCFCS